MKAFFQNSGGRGGIRTLDTDNRMPPFQGGTFNHSATLPRWSELTVSSESAIVQYIFKVV